MSTKSRISGNITVYEMPSETYHEIDEVLDWKLVNDMRRTPTMGKANKTGFLGLFSVIPSAEGDKAIYHQPKNDQETLLNNQKFLQNALLSKKETYNSYQKFNPGQYEENSPKWQIAMLQYLMDMKRHGRKIQESFENKVTFKDLKIRSIMYYFIYYNCCILIYIS